MPVAIPNIKVASADGRHVIYDNANSFPVVDSLVPQSYASVLVDAVRLDDDPVTYTSEPLDVRGWNGVHVQIGINSTLAPTNVRVLLQTTIDGALVTWADFLEGLWASLSWEDTATAAGIVQSFTWPNNGADYIRFVVTATGSDAGNFFDVTITARQFRGAIAMAHA